MFKKNFFLLTVIVIAISITTSAFLLFFVADESQSATRYECWDETKWKTTCGGGDCYEEQYVEKVCGDVVFYGDEDSQTAALFDEDGNKHTASWENEGASGCGDCGSCNDSRYRWCEFKPGVADCTDYTCECRPDWEGCNGNGNGNGWTPPPPPQTCNPNEFDAGNCQRCFADGSGWSGACTDWGDSVGTWCSCELKCTGRNDNPACVGVITIPPPPPPPPPTVNLSAPSIVEVPNAIVLTWSSSNTDSCSASGNWSGSKPTSGTETIKSKTTTADRGTYNFTLSCSGSGGSASDSLSVKVIQVPYCIFSADPYIIILPQLSTLSWECVYADSCEINQGIGSVNQIAAFLNVRPKETTTYTLDCQGLDGSRQFQTDVGVGFIPVWREVFPR